MPRYKAIIAYDGTHFHGFQKQPNERTVQEEIEKTLARMNNGCRCSCNRPSDSL